MSENETAAATPAPAAPAPAKPAPPPKRDLPTPEEIAAFMRGEDLSSFNNLFNLLKVKTFDALYMQIRRAELVPQHWQVISDHAIPDGLDFDTLGAVGRLRTHYKDQEKSRRRLAALRTAWQEMAGKNPSLWTVPDLFAALRRIYEKNIEVDHHELFSATRDIWATMTLPHGREQLDILWNVLDKVREKTKK